MPKSKINDTQREQILKLLASGRGVKEIALELDVTTHQVAAVKAHVTMRSYGSQDPLSNDSVRAPVEINQDINTSHEVAETVGLIDEIQSSLSPDAILVGQDVTTGKKIFWDPDPDYGSANPHLMIIGESGFGKTYTIQCLVAELAQRGVPSVIIDYGQGFDLQTSPKEFKTLAHPVEVMAGEQGINVNPLQIHPNDVNGPLNVAVRVSDCFSRVYRIGVQQHALLRDVVIKVFEDFGIYRSDKSTWWKPPPSLSDVENKLLEIAREHFNETSKVALSLKSHVSTFFVFNTFRQSGESLRWDSFMDRAGKTLVIQLKGLEGRTQQVVTEFLLWDIYHFMMQSGPKALSLFCVLDEAHNLSFESGAPVDRLIREARKFGLGLILASQQAEDFSDTAYANTASKLIFQTLDEKRRVSRKIASKCKNYKNPSLLSDVVAKLPRGQAFFVTRNYGFSVKITPFSERQMSSSAH